MSHKYAHKGAAYIKKNQKKIENDFIYVLLASRGTWSQRHN